MRRIMLSLGMLSAFAVLASSQISSWTPPTVAGYDKWIAASTVDSKDASGNPLKAPDGVQVRAASVKVVEARTPDAKKAALYVLNNSRGMRVAITNYGA
jgi:hypothetical protein